MMSMLTHVSIGARCREFADERFDGGLSSEVRQKRQSSQTASEKFRKKFAGGVVQTAVRVVKLTSGGDGTGAG